LSMEKNKKFISKTGKTIKFISVYIIFISVA